jgi:hypothetical protein
MAENTENDTLRSLDYSSPSTPRPLRYGRLAVVSLALSILLIAGAAFLVANFFQFYIDIAAEAMPLQQQAKQMDTAARAAAGEPPHRALTAAEADAAIECCAIPRPLTRATGRFLMHSDKHFAG